MPEQKRWTKRPENSTWGDYGPDDQLGRMNELTPERVKQGIAEAKEGTTFCLSMPLDYPGGNILNPRRHPPQIRPSLRGDKPNWHYRVEWDKPGFVDVINDDAVIMHLQYSTQWDSLAHVGQLFDADGDGKPEPVFYNGFRAGKEISGPTDPDDAGARDRLEDEIGDLLFVAANIARHANVDVGAAMRRANLKFERRFRAMEALAEAEGTGLAGLSLQEQDRYWDRAKADEKR